MKDRKNDSLYALGICHHPHRASPAPDFPERSFYEVGGSQAAPKLRPLDLKEVKQLIEILFQTGHSPWIKADGIYMLGSGWRTLGIIEMLEQDMGVPVIHPVPARVWAIQKRLHVRQPVKGYGCLLEKMP